MKVIDVEDFRYEIGNHFDYAEFEGGFPGAESMRFDKGDVSMWLYAGSFVESFHTLPASLQKKIKPILKQYHIRIES